MCSRCGYLRLPLLWAFQGDVELRNAKENSPRARLARGDCDHYGRNFHAPHLSELGTFPYFILIAFSQFSWKILPPSV